VTSKALVIDGLASQGSMNAFAIDIEDVYGLVILSDCNLPQVSVSHDFSLPYGTYDVTIIDWTNVPTCSLLIEQTLSVQSLISNLNTSSLPDFAVTNETVLELVVWMFGGTAADVSTDWQDGTFSSISCVHASELSVVIFNYTYDNSGNFTVSIVASNALNSLSTDNQTISVQQRIHDLMLDGDQYILVPPGEGSWTLSAGPQQPLPVEHFFCVWNMGSSYQDSVDYIALLDKDMARNKTFTYVRDDAATQTVTANCSNDVSYQVLTLEVDVIWDNITLGELVCNSSVLWNHTVSCQVTIERFGTGSCFEWNMGDGKPVLYGRDGYCAAYIPAEPTPTFVEVDYYIDICYNTTLMMSSFSTFHNNSQTLVLIHRK